MLTKHLEELGGLLPAERPFTEEERIKNLEMFVMKNHLHLQNLRNSQYAKNSDTHHLQDYKDYLQHANKCYKLQLYGATESVLVRALIFASNIENNK